MPNNNELPLIITIDPTQANRGAEAIVQSINSIKAAAAASGRNFGDGFKVGVSNNEGHVKLFYKSLDKMSKDHSRAIIEDNLRTQNTISSRAAIQQVRDKQMYDAGVKAFQQSEKEKVTAAKEAAAAMAKLSSGGTISGIRTPAQVAQELEGLKQARAMWIEAGAGAEGYSGALAQITSRTNVLTEGNARARGGFHRLTASLASLAFELTGAIYGLTALGALVSGPALFGISYLKSIEDAKFGMVGTLIAMGKFPEGADKYTMAMQTATETTKGLEAASLKFAIPLDDIVGTFRAVVASGLQAGMTLEEVGKSATIGAVAVKSLGLDSRQVVQEMRDLFMGGIQPASSTLATSLGLRDSDIKKAKAEAAAGIRSFYDFIMDKLDGYAVAASHRTDTLSGSIDFLQIALKRLFADESLFAAAKTAINGVTDSIGTFDKATNKFTINEGVLTSLKVYLALLGDLASGIATVIKFLFEYGKHLALLAAALTLATTGTRLFVLGGAAIETVTVAYKGAALAAGTLAEAHIAAGIAAGVAGARTTATLATVTAGIGGAAASIGAMVGKAGLIGLALFALFEVANFLGIVDKILGGAAQRIDTFRDRISGIKSTIEIDVNTEKVKADLKIAEGMMAKSTKFYAGNTLLGSTSKIKTFADGTIANPKASQATIDAYSLQHGKLGDSISTATYIEESKRQLAMLAAQKAELSKPKVGASVDYNQRDSAMLTQNDALMKGSATQQMQDLITKKSQMVTLEKQFMTRIAEEESKQKKLTGVALSDSLAQTGSWKKKLSDLQSGIADQQKLIDKPSDKLNKAAIGAGKAQTRDRVSEVNDAYVAEQVAKKSALDVEKIKLSKELVDVQVRVASGTLGVRDAEMAQYSASLLTNDAQQKIVNSSEAEMKAKQASILATKDANAMRDFAVKLDKEHNDVLAIKAERILLVSNHTLAATVIDKAAQDAIYTNTKSIEDSVSAYNLQLRSIGKTTIEVNRLNAARQREIYLRDKLTTADSKGGRVSNPAVTKEERASIEAKAKSDEDLANAQSDYQNSYMGGWDRAFDSYSKSATNAADASAKVFTDAFQGMEDAMTTFVTTGKLSFSALAKSIIDDMIKIAVKKAVLGLVEMGIGAFAGAAGGSSSTLSTSSQTAIANGNMTIPKANALGGVYNSPSLSAYSGGVYDTPQTFMFAKGAGVFGEAGPEAILPLNRGVDGKLGVKMSGGNGGSGDVQINVEVNVAADGKSDTKTDGTGNSKALGNMLANEVKTIIMKELRPGGLLGVQR